MENSNLNRADDATLAQRANSFLLIAVAICVAGSIPIFFNLYDEFTSKTGIGHIESSVFEHIPGTGRNNLGNDVYHLRIRYVQPPLNRVTNFTADFGVMPMSDDKMVTFLYDPNDPSDIISISGFWALYGHFFMIFVYALGALGAWRMIKPKKKTTSDR
jgi:hypothetical protein